MKTRTIYKSPGCWTQAERAEVMDYYRAELKEQGVDHCNDNDIYDMIADMERMDFEDEYENLNMPLDGRILVIADLGLWNGRRQGYKVIGSNLQDIMTAATKDDDFHIYSDGKDIRAEGRHHDGTNYYLFREIRDDIDNIDPLLIDIYNGETISNRRLGRYTKSLAPYVASVYGW